MIRRQEGDRFLLITQNDHAQLSGRIAEHFGNDRFATPDPRAPTVTAISMHDCGWLLHDERPMLNKDGLPLDVFECPLENSVRVWAAAADAAQEHGAYVGLLVSLHVLGLSGFAASRPHTRQEIFELNRFQHREIERQQRLRLQLGMAVDRPTNMGLAVEDDDPAERRLSRNHGLMQVHDRLSLALCCTDVPFDTIENVVPREGQSPVKLRLARPSPTSVAVDPWPFDEARIALEIPYKAVPARRYTSEGKFQRFCSSAEPQMLQLALIPDSRNIGI